MATHEGFTILDASQYEALRDNRLYEDAINLGQIYSAYFKLKNSDAEAARNPVSIQKRNLRRIRGGMAITLTVLDSRLKPAFSHDGVMESGLWIPSPDLHFSEPVQARVAEVYLADYDDGMPKDLFLAIDRSDELVGAGSAGRG